MKNYYLIPVRYPPTEEVFFVQNAGDPDAGTGLKKSSVVEKIRLADAEAVRNGSHTDSEVKVHVLSEEPKIINPNGKVSELCFRKLLIKSQVEPITRDRSSLQEKVKEIGYHRHCT